MPGITTNDNVQQTTDEKPKLAEQIDLEEAETALAGKDYKTARELLEKLGKISAVSHIRNFRDAAGDGYLHPEMISSPEGYPASPAGDVTSLGVSDSRCREPETHNKFPRKDSKSLCELSIISKASIKMDLKMGPKPLHVISKSRDM